MSIIFDKIKKMEESDSEYLLGVNIKEPFVFEGKGVYHKYYNIFSEIEKINIPDITEIDLFLCKNFKNKLFYITIVYNKDNEDFKKDKFYLKNKLNGLLLDSDLFKGDEYYIDILNSTKHNCYKFIYIIFTKDGKNYIRLFNTNNQI